MAAFAWQYMNEILHFYNSGECRGNRARGVEPARKIRFNGRSRLAV
jgi:hypothetical protein